MTLADLIASFEERAEKTVDGKFWLSAKQVSFVKALATKEKARFKKFANTNAYIVESPLNNAWMFVGTKAIRIGSGVERELSVSGEVEFNAEKASAEIAKMWAMGLISRTDYNNMTDMLFPVN